MKIAEIVWCQPNAYISVEEKYIWFSCIAMFSGYELKGKKLSWKVRDIYIRFDSIVHGSQIHVNEKARTKISTNKSQQINLIRLS